MRKKKKKKSRRIRVPAIPPLSLEALDDVQEIERYARQELRECQHSGHINSQKAERILRTCTVHVLKKTIAYYESLPTFHEEWIIELQTQTIESAVGMLPDGYGEALYEHFRDVLWKTTYADLNPPKRLTVKKEETPKLTAPLGEQVKRLRDECRLTTEGLAEEVRLDIRSVQRHLAGKVKPYARHLKAYENAFSKLLGRKVIIETLP